MISQIWMYDAIVYTYALSLLFYFSDSVKPSRRAKRMGTGLLALVWVFQSLFLADRVVELRYMPVFSLFETLFFYAWLMVTFSLVANWFLRIDMLTFFMNVIGFTVSVINMFGYSLLSPAVSHWETRDELLFLHIAFAVGSYVAFSVSAVFAGMHLFLHRQLKRKQWNAAMRRLPSMDQVDSYSYRTCVIGIPLLVVSLAIGFAELVLLEELGLMLDPKVLLSMLILAAYAYYLVARKTLAHPGHRLAGWNLAGFALVLMNIGVSAVSRFH